MCERLLHNSDRCRLAELLEACRREGRIFGFFSTMFAVIATRSKSHRLIQLALTVKQLYTCSFIPFEGYNDATDLQAVVTH